jgi:hypothetical protein
MPRNSLTEDMKSRMLELMCSRLGVTVEDLRGGKVDWNRDKSKVVWSVAHEVVGFTEKQLEYALMNYRSPSHGSYRPALDDRLNVVAPQWGSTADPDGKKAELKAMALRGEPRPVSRGKNKHPLGAVLCLYTNPNSKSYDPVFDKEIRALAPGWFLDTAARNKAELKAMALRGEPRPVSGGKNRHPLGRALSSYTRPSSQSYDPVFDQEIRALAPQWFLGSAARNKAELLAMALRGEPRPGAGKNKHPLGQVLSQYTNPKSQTYDPVFDKEIRALRPDWFLDTVAQNKAELKAMALRGEPKPASTGKNRHPLGVVLCMYTNPKSKMYDPVFDREIRALRPDWFLDTVAQNKAELKAMALRGEPRPVSSGKRKHPLGQALSRYTNPNSKSYDPVFDKEIRALRPDWFLIGDKSRKAHAKKKEQACTSGT